MNWLRLLFLIPLLTAFAGWLLWSVVGAIRSGVANAGGRRVDARRTPVLFGLTLLVQSAFSALSLWLAFDLLRSTLRS